jgi:hypothetical protein
MRRAGPPAAAFVVMPHVRCGGNEWQPAPRRNWITEGAT